MQITSERQYIENGNACVYKDEDGYVYQDAFGYKTFKTLKGLNNHIRKVAAMGNREAVQITD